MTARNNNTRRRELIRSKLFIARISQNEIAQHVGVSRGLVCNVVAGRRGNQAVQHALAKAVGMKPTELWED